MAKKKKTTKKKVISKTEKALRNKRNYQLTLRRKSYKQLNEGIEALLKSSSKIIGKNTTYFVPLKVRQDLNITKKDYRATKQTILNAYYNKTYKISSAIHIIENKLTKRFKFKEKKIKTTKRKNGDIVIQLGFVWDLSTQVTNGVFKNNAVKNVNGMNKKTDAPKILDEFNELNRKIGSTQFVQLVGQKGDFRIEVLNLEDEKLEKKQKSWRKNK